MNKIGKWILVGMLAVLGAILVFYFYLLLLVFWDELYFDYLVFIFLQNWLGLSCSLLWISSIIVAMAIGKTKGRVWTGFILGLLLTCLGVSIMIVLKPKSLEDNRSGERGHDEQKS